MPRRPRTVLVLGGGGAVGAAYHCGCLRALQDVTGMDPREADLLVGTSSGAAMATELALGRSIDELAAQVHPDEHPADHPLEPVWRSRTDLARRAVGSSYVVARTTLGRRWPMPEPPRWLQRVWPGSLYSVGGGDWGADRYPDEWPAQRLWLIAADLDRGGRRVVLDGEDSAGLGATLSAAVMASCAVPGVFAPVRVGGRRLIDGGLRSSTNLDLVRRFEADRVIVLAPMAFEPDPAPGWREALGRKRFNTRLEREAIRVRDDGTDVLVLRPGAEELRHHATNILSHSSSETVMATAYASTVTRLTTGGGR